MTQVALWAAVLWVTAAFVAGSVAGAGVVWWDKRGDYEDGWDAAERAILGDPEPEAIEPGFDGDFGAGTLRLVSVYHRRTPSPRGCR